MSDDDVDWIIQVNLMGAINCVRAFHADMVAAGGGHITATSSSAGLFPGLFPIHASYSAAKMGIIGLMMNLAHELAPHDIHTTIYCPCGVSSGMKENNSLYRPTRFGGPSEGGVQVPAASHTVDLLKETPITFYKPEHIAPIVLDAVTRNRPFVFDHAEQKHFFKLTYAEIVEDCFDDIADYERIHGTPPVDNAMRHLGGE
jgi:NAD(P)-dependent dehydrogenase (short-subunit alcohol dehydrogenase family)